MEPARPEPPVGLGEARLAGQRLEWEADGVTRGRLRAMAKRARAPETSEDLLAALRAYGLDFDGYATVRDDRVWTAAGQTIDNRAR